MKAVIKATRKAINQLMEFLQGFIRLPFKVRDRFKMIRIKIPTNAPLILSRLVPLGRHPLVLLD